MYTTRNEEGVLNNYDTKPKVYCVTYPSQEEQNSYLFQGALAVLFVTSLVLVALGVS